MPGDLINYDDVDCPVGNRKHVLFNVKRANHDSLSVNYPLIQNRPQSHRCGHAGCFFVRTKDHPQALAPRSKTDVYAPAEANKFLIWWCPKFTEREIILTCIRLNTISSIFGKKPPTSQPCVPQNILSAYIEEQQSECAGLHAFLSRLLQMPYCSAGV